MFSIFTHLTNSEEATENVRLFRQNKVEWMKKTVDLTYENILENIMQNAQLGQVSVYIDINFMLVKAKEIPLLYTFSTQDYQQITERVKTKLLDNGFTIKNDNNQFNIIWKDPDDCTAEETAKEERAEFEKEIIETAEGVAKTAGKILLKVGEVAIESQLN